MPKIIVDVMPKPEILDPQGKAIGAALARLGIEGFREVRQGKRFELKVHGEITDEVLAKVQHAAETLLSNPVIEDVVSVKQKECGGNCGCGHAKSSETPNGQKDLLA
ncbi:phosphoribosylformylglycinamidine synthase subunit PurS [Demequina sp. TTPB684]|uniref:phosphoribosylformylglycinamidine synthase subunit PurS n=1 Tax=unclassified Demequina TaxID=2620311 RepID=UPI001CF4A8EE|nr:MULTISPECIES: phosphoribosylformylglycinamidine synthase subunit PurS [unclassified Demequina]MCB2412702.1 phosphoribosylformylglycinamidine synthase subunit PurS [Demequina sp. TTPB684]UPU87659.1 phosphoribosylformylglycinamidine synthase subunit PurS [Demequina sp. TMPB413]